MAGTLNAEAFDAIEGKLRSLIEAGHDQSYSAVSVDLYDLEAMMDRSEMRKRTMDVYYRALYEMVL